MIYDIIEKPRIHMKQGETDEQFEARRAALIAKSKTGTTNAKKQAPEDENTFLLRCAEAITDANFRRVVVRFNDKERAEVMREVWEQAQVVKI